MIEIVSIETFVYRVPLDRPVRTSFGEMRDRPAVLVRLTDADGNHGWGEAFCNWPAAGAEHRARLILEDLSELVFSESWSSPAAMFTALSEMTEIKVLQTAEPGPFAQAIAALDIACCDLAARRDGISLSCILNPAASDRVGAYASGIHIDDAPEMIPAARAKGFRAFKVKIGFDYRADAEKVRRVRGELEPDEHLMTDANQGWSVDETAEFLDAVADLNLAWLEEPIRVDAPCETWERLARGSAIPLAGGENLLGADEFIAAIDAGYLGVIQPDAMKWGGITGCFEMGVRAKQAGRLYCPHYLGGGVGLLASAHILAAVGGDGFLEIDVNPNPLRSDMFPGWPELENGLVAIMDGPGLGAEPSLDAFVTYQVFSGERHSGRSKSGI